ncbi:PTS system, mannose-specific IIB component/PTS system, fructoselysine and glucoselysine-specific IIB component [Clostridium amylolyticum]|uniref:PTS system, mannose-specific IIB component/PTS system, fructoselysine and glucoselysine-specific IIB component n=1 Tax=Clostridium amylolyticum TaxID=1121298 RepID=A0A1M6GL82_9CLOT|nr:PTS sugar transporter subunit IIB [Clostridium amylolyticum]SHJ10701.1 PTS system, mannose-specific IIB component/PTS system, fructoselysine and glucoselysine-specific IIB component [Clostridium amylolyticum]
MIVKIRIDDRLLHGQVAYSWKSALSYDAIVIASDSAANDDIRKMAIKLCCPDGVKLAIRSISDAATLLKNPKLSSMKVFVICPNPESVHDLLQLIEERPAVNLGGMQMEPNKVLFSPAVYVNKEDIEYLDKLVASGIRVEVQEVPSKSMKDYSSLRNKISL